MLAIKTILCPTDFSEYSQAAFQLACSLARDHDARLVVLHVYPAPLTHGEVVARRQPDSYYDDLRRLLGDYQDADLGEAVSHRLEEGHPAPEILRVAHDLDCDLVVLGTHGRTGLRRLLMGSVAEQVVREAPCPVLTVKTPHSQEPAAPSTQPTETR